VATSAIVAANPLLRGLQNLLALFFADTLIRGFCSRHAALLSIRWMIYSFINTPNKSMNVKSLMGAPKRNKHMDQGEWKHEKCVSMMACEQSGPPSKIKMLGSCLILNMQCYGWLESLLVEPLSQERDRGISGWHDLFDLVPHPLGVFRRGQKPVAGKVQKRSETGKPLQEGLAGGCPLTCFLPATEIACDRCAPFASEASSTCRINPICRFGWREALHALEA
jgi:hypothetical protein